MAHPHFQTNGASLEDCHTNFFALTDLCGIRWRRLVSEGYSSSSSGGFHPQQHGMGGRGNVNNQPAEFLADPVLLSYSRCLSNDILCVWRRIPSSSQPSPNSAAFPPFGHQSPFQNPMNNTSHSGQGNNHLNGIKELWIFWYGDEPDLSNMVAPELMSSESEQGSWENGLSYECRSLLFKALHNLIERCLLSKNFVRLGKWFVQPQEVSGSSTEGFASNPNSITMTNLSFSFSFFVHGESTVCASIDIRQHPVIRRVTRRHISAAHASNQGLHVVLAPYGLAGILTGNCCTAADHAARRILEEWRQFYPIENYSCSPGPPQRGPGPGGGDDPTLGSADCPALVEVLIGGIRMKYPNCFVFVCDADNSTNQAVLNQLLSPEGGTMLPTPPHSPASYVNQTVIGSGSSLPQLSGAVPAVAASQCTVVSSSHDPLAARSLADHAWQDSILSSAFPCAEGERDKETSILWEFGDPAVKTNCVCSRSRPNKITCGSSDITSNAIPSTEQKVKGTVPNSAVPGRSRNGGAVPFHLRPSRPAPLSSLLSSSDADENSLLRVQDRVQDRPPTSSSSDVSSASSQSLQLPSYHRTQAIPSHNTQQRATVNTLKTSVQTSTTLMQSPSPITPSPQRTPLSQQPVSVPSADTAIPAPSPIPPPSNDLHNLLPATPVIPEAPQHASSNSSKATPLREHTPNGPKSNQAFSPYVGLPSVDTPGWPNSVDPSSISRPMTTSGAPASGTTSRAVDSSPSEQMCGIKRPALPFKEYEEDLEREDSSVEVLYDFTSLTAWLHHPVKKLRIDSSSTTLPSSAKETPKAAENVSASQASCCQTAIIPENSAETAEVDTNEDILDSDVDNLTESRKRKELDGREDDDGLNVNSKAPNPSSLFTSQGLEPSIRDLENIFDNSDETNDDTFAVPTPPGSNKSAGMSDDTASGVKPINARVASAHPSPGSGIHYSGLGGGLGGISVLASAELSKMFPTPPSHDHPMQSPCGHMDALADLADGQIYALVKAEPAFGAASPSTSSEDKDWSSVYRPPAVAKPVSSARYAPLPQLPSQTLPPLSLPSNCVYRSSFLPTHHQHLELQRSMCLQPPPSLRPFGRLPMPPPPHFTRGLGPAPFSPISPSPYMDGGPPFHHGMGLSRLPLQNNFSPQISSSSNTLKHLLQHQQQQQLHHHQALQHHQQQQQPVLPECHSLTVNMLLGESLLNIFRDHNFDSCPVCVCSAGPNCVGTIKGPDAAFYLPDSAKGACHANNRPMFPGSFPYMNSMNNQAGLGGPPNFLGVHSGNLADDENVPYNCGFSAVVNRRLAHRSGLFYEDEVDIIGASLTLDPAIFKQRSLFSVCQAENDEQSLCVKPRALEAGCSQPSSISKTKKCPDKTAKIDTISSTTAAVAGNATLVDTVSPALMEILREQCLLVQHPNSPIAQIAAQHAARRKSFSINKLEYSDCNEVVRSALSLSILNTPAPPVMQQQQQHHHQQHPMASPYHQQPQQHWQQPHPHQPHPYMQFNNQSPAGMGFNPALHPMSPVSLPPPLHSPSSVAIRGRPPNPSCGPNLPRPVLPSPAATSSVPVVHYWPFLHAKGPKSSQDILRVMRTLQPLLQEAIQKKQSAQLWGAPFTVHGPLTWRQFHRMAVRGTEDRCEPQPIPAVLAGYDRDWVSVAPLAIPHWERLLLEPYSQPKDVAYIIVAPDVDFVLGRVKSYFRELSAVYEACRLGRHVPAAKFKLNDGILRVSRVAADHSVADPSDDWFTCIGDSQVAALLRLYARVCRHQLGPLLAGTTIDRTLLDPPLPTRPSQPVPSPMAPPAATPANNSEITPNCWPSGPANQTATQGPSPSAAATPGLDAIPQSPRVEIPDVTEPVRSEQTQNVNEIVVDEEEGEVPSVVIYMVDPFSMGTDACDVRRLCILGLLRCYQEMLSLLPDSVQSVVSLQLISLDAIMQLGPNCQSSLDSLRSLALTVFSQCRKVHSQVSSVKSLTGFGPGASADLFVKNKDEKNKMPFRLYNPPFVLAPLKDRTLSDLDSSPPSSANSSTLPSTLPSNLMPKGDKFSVLYVSYCLSEDQRWLLASCSDDRGELVENCTIGIDIPNRTRRKRYSARLHGLQKLMDFIVGVISTSVHPWRLVIGRLGRMGHGELKSWSALLSRKSLMRLSRHVADICKQCSLLYPTDVPAVVSACLVSLEPDSQFRMMPDQITPDERFGQQSANCSLSTPEDASCTHILVFPTSATTTSSQTAFHEQHINGPDLGDDDFILLNDDMGDGFEGMGDLQDIFMWPEADSVNDVDNDLANELSGGVGGSLCSLGGLGPSLSPGAPHGANSPNRRAGLRGSLPESPSCMGGGRQSPGRAAEVQEEVGTLLQQPLALAYYVSTAPTGDMPTWFWASCPHLANVCPSFLKCALHLHNHAAQQGSDDLLQLQQQQSNSGRVHPLDSQVTTDVLRFVMEGYNALSWLALDPQTKDRRSCLPVHIQLLVQLYHAMAALV